MRPSICWFFGLLLLVVQLACKGNGSTAPDGGPSGEPSMDASVPDAGGGMDGGSFVFEGDCTPLGGEFCSVNPTPFPASVFDVDAVAANDAWFVGDGALLAHWDGMGMHVYAAGDAEGHRFDSVDAVSSDCAWAAGHRSVVRWNGQTWTPVADPPEDVMQVVAPTCDAPLVRAMNAVYRWDGAAWQKLVDGSALSPPAARLSALAARATEIWLGGSAENIYLYQSIDGGEFTGVSTPGARVVIPARIVLHPNGDVTLFGEDERSAIVREGGQWKDLPDFPYVVRMLAVDAQGTRWIMSSNLVDDHTKVSRLDGTAWTEVTRLYRPVLGGNLQLWTMAPDGARGLWLAGANGAVVHFDGTSWNTLAQGALWQRTGGARVGDRVWTIGVQGLIEVGPNTVTPRDMTPPGSAITQHALLVRSPSDVWVAGYEYRASAPITHWNGTSFSSERLPPPGIPRIQALFEVSGELWAVNNNVLVPTSSAIVRRDASGAWTQERGFARMAAVQTGWSDGSTVIAAGANDSGERLVYRYANGQWDADATGPIELFRLAGPDLDHLYAVGKRTLHRYDGGAWTVLKTFDESVIELNDLVVRGTDVWVVGTRSYRSDGVFGAPGGAILVHYDGQHIEETLIPGLPVASSLFFVGDEPWVVGPYGAIVRKVTR